MSADRTFRVPLIIRGQIIDDKLIEFGGRRGGARFLTPNVSQYLDRIGLRTPSSMADLYTLTFDGIVDYLVQLGKHLDPDTNPYLQESYELSRHTSGLSDGVLLAQYRRLGRTLTRDRLYEAADRACGIAHLEGWVDMGEFSGIQGRAFVRAFGARAVHVIAGNAPVVTAMTIARNALTRSDCIIKTPSNDPLTAAAFARTMIDMAPDHPLTKHLSVAYWKGG